MPYPVSVQLAGTRFLYLITMKKLTLLLLLFCSMACFSQDKDSLKTPKPKVFSRVAPVVEYEITHDFRKIGPHQYEMVTKLYVLRQRQTIFEIFARWESLVRQSSLREKVEEYHKSLAEKELKLLGYE